MFNAENFIRDLEGFGIEFPRDELDDFVRSLNMRNIATLSEMKKYDENSKYLILMNDFINNVRIDEEKEKRFRESKQEIMKVIADDNEIDVNEFNPDNFTSAKDFLVAITSTRLAPEYTRRYRETAEFLNKFGPEESPKLILDHKEQFGKFRKPEDLVWKF